MDTGALYPGTFDPVTFGHLDIINRAAKLYGRLFIGVAHSEDKKPLFSVKERVSMLKNVTAHLKNVEVGSFGGLAVDYAKSKKVRLIVRGLRMLSDFEFEFQMALTNKTLAGGIETIFMMTSEKYAHFSSKLIKETAAMGADAKNFVPPLVAEKLKGKLG